jgi:hypothetical protein
MLVCHTPWRAEGNSASRHGMIWTLYFVKDKLNRTESPLAFQLPNRVKLAKLIHISIARS